MIQASRWLLAAWLSASLAAPAAAQSQSSISGAAPAGASGAAGAVGAATSGDLSKGSLLGPQPGALALSLAPAPQSPVLVVRYLRNGLADLAERSPADAARKLARTLAGSVPHGASASDPRVQDSIRAANQALAVLRDAAASPELLRSPRVRQALEAALPADVVEGLESLGRRVSGELDARVWVEDLLARRAVDRQAVANLLAEASIAASILSPELLDDLRAYGGGAAIPVASGAESARRDAAASRVALEPYQPALKQSRAAARSAGAPNASRAPASSKWRLTAMLAPLFAALGLLPAQAAPTAAPTAAPSAYVLQVGQPIAAAATAPIEKAKPADYETVKDVGELVAKWSPDRHVYVLGDLAGPPAIDAERLRALEGRLKGTHWTIVIARSAGNEQFMADGQRRTGPEAVKYAVGHGIGHQARFKAQTHPATGETDGTLWYVVLDAQEHGYQGSDAQDSRGLGAAQYKSALQRPFLDQMKANRDVVTAIERVAANVDAQLGAAIARETGDAQAKIRQAEAKTAELRAASARLAKANPAASKAAGSTDFQALEQGIDAAKAELKASRPRQAGQQADQVIGAANAGLSLVGGVEGALGSAQAELAKAEAASERLSRQTSEFRARHDVSGAIGSAELAARVQAEIAGAKVSLRDGKTAEAQAAAQRAAQAAQAATVAMEAYPAGASEIAALTERLGKAQRDRFAGAARAEMLAAKQAVEDAGTQYAKGDPAYPQAIAAADQALKAAERLSSEASAAHERKVRAFWTIFAIVTAGFGALGAFLYFRARAARKLAVKELDSWSSVLTSEMERLYLKLEQDVQTWAGPAPNEPKSFGYEGETAKLANEARTYFDLMNRLWNKARATIEAAQALTKPSLKNIFSAGSSRRALAMLQEPLEFLPEQGLDGLLGIVRSSPLKEKLGRVKAAEKRSFQDVMGLYDEMSDAVSANLDEIRQAGAKVKPELDRLAKLVQDAAARRPEIDAQGKDGLFLVPSIFAQLLPAASRLLEQASLTAAHDPVGAIKRSGADAQRMAEEASQLSELIVAARKGPLAQTTKSAAALKAGGIQTAWLDKGLLALSGRAEELALKADSEPMLVRDANGQVTRDKLAEYKEQIGAFASKVARAAALEQSLRETARPKLAQAEATVALARRDIAAGLGVEPSKVLVEEADGVAAEIEAALRERAGQKGSTLTADEIAELSQAIAKAKTVDPTARLAEAAKRADAAERSLGEGQTEAAAKALDQAGDLHDAVVAIVTRSVTIFRSGVRAMEAPRAATRRLEDAVHGAEQALERIRKGFAASVLKQTAGDPTHPGADGTIENNIAETSAHLASAREATDSAVAAFGAGKLLRAAALLQQTGTYQQLAAHRLAEIAEKEARLKAAVQANQAALADLDRRAREELPRLEREYVTTQPTAQAIGQARRTLEEARRNVEGSRLDPFQGAEALGRARAAFDQIANVLAKNDGDCYREAERSVQAAGSALEAARQQASVSQRDADDQGQSLADSEGIRRALQGIGSLESRWQAAKQSLGQPHSDWNAIDREADDVANAAGAIQAALRQELAAGARAVDAIRSAAAKVREANDWRGGYNVYVDASAASERLRSAREHLRQGRYVEAGSAADNARSLAASAIAHAAAAVQAHIEAERQRIAAERAAAAAREAAQRAAERAARDAWDNSRPSGGAPSWNPGGGGGGDTGGSPWGGGGDSSGIGGGTHWGGGGGDTSGMGGGDKWG
ncbi:MAG: hypothetical protein HY554_01220 [Elusimicrobia bacterium]|nr:hypothetical protein [Elusimicrobiota bacterium]